jgi:hypothetical protein
VKLLAGLLVALLPHRAAAVEVPGSGGRLRVGGYVDGLAVVETEDSEDQAPQGLVDLFVEGAATRWLRGRLELRSRVGGPFEGGHPGVFNFVHEFQNYTTPSLELSEAYADVHLAKADVRVGVQKFAWGKLDGVPPTDVLNPRDFHDPLVQDVEERKIGSPAVQGTYYLPELPRLELSGLRATLIYLPIAVPSRLALAEERWFPSSIAPVPRITIPKDDPLVASILGGDTPLRIPVRFATRSDRPPLRFDAGGLAARLGGTWRDMDWDLYYYTGPETGPNAALRADATLLNVVAAEPGVPDDIGEIDVRIDSQLRQAHDVIHMTGADWAATLGGLTVRAEGAYFDDRPYLRLASDLIAEARRNLDFTKFGTGLKRGTPRPIPIGDLFPDVDSVEWGVGADYLWRGFQPLVQVNQIILLERAPRLLIADPETRFTGVLRRRFMAERVELEVRGIYAKEREAWFVFPRASYLVRDDFRIRVGYLAIGGPTASLLGQFASNDEVVLQARWSF